MIADASVSIALGHCIINCFLFFNFIDRIQVLIPQ